MANKAQLQTNNIVLNEYITKIQELKGIASALPDNGSGIILPTLTNAGVAADLALGKQLIDSNGNIITGTHECESDSGDSPATKIIVPNTTQYGTSAWTTVSASVNAQSSKTTFTMTASPNSIT